MGSKREYKRTPWTREELDQLKTLIDAGTYSWDEITRKLNRSISTCTTKAEQMGWRKRAALMKIGLKADKMPSLDDVYLEHKDGREVYYG